MRIAIVTPWYPSKSNPLYGVFIQNQVIALSHHCSVFVLLMKWSIFPYTKERKEGKVTIIEKGSFYLPNASEIFLDYWASNYVDFFKTIHNKYEFDLIHCHDHYGTFVGDKIKNQLSLPYVCTIHNSNIMNDKLVDWKQAYISRILSNANVVFAVSAMLADVLEEKYQINDVKVVPNYIDTNLFTILPDRKHNEFSFIFVGGLEPHKGIVQLVTAFYQANLVNASLHIIGSGNLYNKLATYIRDNELKESVFLHGDIPNHELPKFYNSSNVCVSVSEYETFGVTILEAMSCGLPILYTDSGGPNELVMDFAGVKIIERTIPGIIQGLNKMKEVYSSFDSEQIRAHVVKNYGTENSIGVLLTEYKTVLNV